MRQPSGVEGGGGGGLRLSQEPQSSYDLFLPKLPSKILRCPHDQLAASVRWPCMDRAMLPTMCLRATGLLVFKTCHSAELTKS